jgi:hypothetical protein
MPVLLPAVPNFATPSEQKVWETLRGQLAEGDVLIANQRLTDRRKDHEIDIAVAFEHGGVVVVEVKGGQVRCDQQGWWIERHSQWTPIDPVTQAREGLYAFRTWITNTPQWGSRTPVR